MELIEAVKNNNINKVNKLLKNNYININYKEENIGNTALFFAIDKNNKDMVELLLKHKAYINIQNYFGFTALTWAIFWKNKNIIELLLKYNADVNVKTNIRNTALIRAVDHNNKDISELLLEYNADINIIIMEKQH